jgi:AcrR family transcriptional regulator
MTVTRKRGPGRPRDEATDTAILDAAVAELIERGYLAASMESVAARAGVAKTTLYRRYSGFHELALAAMRTFDEPVQDPPDGTVREQVLWLLDGMRRKWGNPRYAAIMRRVAADATSSPELYRNSRDQLIGAYVRAMNAVLRRGMDEGLIRPDVEPEWIRQMLVSPIMSAALTMKDRVTRAQVELTVDTVLAGLAPSAQ